MVLIQKLLNITYTPNKQTTNIVYKDKDVPAGWKIIPDQKILETVKVTPDGVPTVVVKIEHKTITVTPETPEGDIPTGKVPGDPSKTYPAMESITKTPTRIITVIKPDEL